MPRWIDDLAIGRKLVLIMMLTVAASLVVACLTFVSSDVYATWRSTKQEVRTLAGILASNSVSALSFEDAEVAKETLETLRSTAGIVGGCLYGPTGRVLARYARPGAEPRCSAPDSIPREPRLEHGELVLSEPVVFQGETLGTVYLRSDLSRMVARVVPYLVGTLLAVGVSSVIALALSSRLKNLVTTPILQLARAVGEVSKTREYSIRVQRRGGDEIGSLMDGFNQMLEQIQNRDEELREAHEQLEQRVAERTAELEVARDAAQAASRAKSEFLANMSHEIRTPLNAVMGLTEVTLRTDLDQTQHEYLTTIGDSAEALLGVLNDILDFSKIEAGKMDMERVPFSIQDTISDSLASLAVRAHDKGLELACYIDPGLPPLLIGDPGRLRQVISNLVSNAIKFTERGEVEVRVEQESDGDPLQLLVSVRDTGIGIPHDVLDRLFEPFEQADTSTTRRYGGSGLGLSISRQLAELMGGEIRAESTPGAGSTFSFRAEFWVPEHARERPAREPLPLAGSRVLIVDDNATNRTILEEVTRAVRMRPLGADGAAAALAGLAEAHAEGDPVVLMLADVHMPDTDGFELVERVRDDGRFDDLAIVFLTSAGQPGDLARCDALDVAARLVKPVRQTELFQVMSCALGLEAPAMSELPLGPADEESEIQLPPLRILLVEDSLANRKVAQAVLGDGHHSIRIAENGRRALEVLAEHDFDVVLMDVQMPEMDGFEATARIRAGEIGSPRHLPIVAMTAHALQGDREKCLAAGMDGYVSKPIRRADLFEALARVAAPECLTRGDTAFAGEAVPRRTRPSIDWSGMREQLAGDQAAMREVAEAYLDEIREALDALPRLLAARDLPELRRRAHSLKGSMRAFGVTEAERVASELEELAEQGGHGDIDWTLDHLRIAVGRMLPELEGFVRGGSA